MIELFIGTCHIGPHLYICAVMDKASRYIIAFRFGKSDSEKLKTELCNDLGIAEMPPKSRYMSSFFGSLSDKINSYIFRNNDERMMCAVEWIEYYNTERMHSAIGYRTPFEVFQENMEKLAEENSTVGLHLVE